MGELRVERLADGFDYLIFPCPICSTEYPVGWDLFPQSTGRPSCGERRTWQAEVSDARPEVG